MGYGGVCVVHRACGLSRKAILKGIGEIERGDSSLAERIRRPGAGRKNLTVLDSGLVAALDDLIEGGTRGDPESPLRWVCKSTRTLAEELSQQAHPVSHMRVAQLLHEQDYSLQSNRKLEEGEDHPDRDAQFRHINRCVKRALAAGEPVISVDTKKKELVGNYANSGQQWRVAKQPQRVKGHDFPGPEVPRAYPYGIYDLGRNSGFVNVGTDHDTGAFAVASIRGWWRFEGRRLYPAGPDAVDHRRWRRQQWVAAATLETRVAGLCRRKWAVPFHLPLSARHQQVEQDRTPTLFVHFVQLAR